jgi:hypothetical protein
VCQNLAYCSFADYLNCAIHQSLEKNFQLDKNFGESTKCPHAFDLFIFFKLALDFIDLQLALLVLLRTNSVPLPLNFFLSFKILASSLC